MSLRNKDSNLSNQTEQTIVENQNESSGIVNTVNRREGESQDKYTAEYIVENFLKEGNSKIKRNWDEF